MQPRGFRLFRRTLVTLALLSVLLVGTAYAAGPGSLWGVFDLTDSRGIRLSQYQMSMDDGTGLTKLNPAKHQYFWVISMLWSGYCSFVGMFCWLLDWTISLSWVAWIAGPLSSIEQTLHGRLLRPIGANWLGGTVMGFMLSIGGAMGAWKIRRGGASGWVDMVGSALAAALTVGILAMPVSTIAGNGEGLSAPLRSAQQMGIGLSQMITTGKAPTTTIGGNVSIDRKDDAKDGAWEPNTKDTGKSKISMMLIDAFVRPVHQQLNYGVVLDETDQKCAEKYDQLLKAGPYGGSAKELRKGMGDCNKQYLTFADAASSSAWPFGFAPYAFAVLCLGLLLLTFAALMWASVISLLWSALCAMFNVILAILPGPARNGLIRDLVSIAAHLVYIVINMVVISVAIKLIELTFTTIAAPLVVKFVVVDILLVAGVGLLIWARWKHSKGEKSILKRLTERVTGKQAQETQTQRVAELATRTAAKGALTKAKEMRKPSKARAALGVATVAAAGAATGGVGAGAATKAVTASRTMKLAKLGRAYQAARSGNAAATTGNKAGDAVMWMTSRAHNYVTDKVKEAKQIYHQAHAGEGPARLTTGSGVVDTIARTSGDTHRKVDRQMAEVDRKYDQVLAPVTKVQERVQEAAAVKAKTVRDHVVTRVEPIRRVTRPPQAEHRRALPAPIRSRDLEPSPKPISQQAAPETLSQPPSPQKANPQVAQSPASVQPQIPAQERPAGQRPMKLSSSRPSGHMKSVTTAPRMQKPNRRRPLRNVPLPDED